MTRGYSKFHPVLVRHPENYHMKPQSTWDVVRRIQPSQTLANIDGIGCTEWMGSSENRGNHGFYIIF